MTLRPPNARSLMIYEFSEFAGFSPSERRYITRSIDVARDSENVINLWSRNQNERKSIHAQREVYAPIKNLRKNIPRELVDESFIASLISVSVFDLGQGKLSGFNAYRFLYERLFGVLVRPWLPSAFCAAAALPQLKPERRKTLLQSISETAATAPAWSTVEPVFFPEWVATVEQYT